MTAFIVLCAVMLVAATTAIAYPLLKRLAPADKGQPAVPPAAVAPAAVIALVLVVGAAATYKHSSNFPWEDPRLAQAAPAAHGAGGESASMDEATRALEAKLKTSPNDLEGWRMLARTYVVSNRPQDAVGAYQKALAITGDGDAALKLDLAEAMILTEDPALKVQARDIIEASLAADGKNQKALWYAGVMAYRANDNATAMARWSTLLELNPPPEIRQIIEQQISALGGAVPAATPAASSAPDAPTAVDDTAGPAPAGRTIRISVSLDPALKDKVKPGTVLFVSAREPGIPGPPLAAVRLTPEELPTTVVLSDANSVVEGRNLSSVNDVEVVARIAFGGAVMSASGDLIGSAIQKKGSAENLNVAITRVQP